MKTDEIRNLLAGATPGPWLVGDTGAWGWLEPLSTRHDGCLRLDDVRLIAALRNAAPDLLAVVDAARVLLRQVDKPGSEGPFKIDVEIATDRLRDAVAKLDAT